jgi:hypothetical protein
MKTTKLILAALLLSLTVYSCSSDRDEEKVNPSSAQKVDLKKLKTINNQKETSKPGDSIPVVEPQRIDPITGEEISNDQEIVHPGDVKPPKP